MILGTIDVKYVYFDKDYRYKFLQARNKFGHC